MSPAGSRRQVTDFQDTIGYSQGSREQMRAASESEAVVEIPGYNLKRELGRGTFGVVWEATRLQTGQEVAVKVVRAQAHVDWRYLERELDSLRALEEHQYTLTVLDAQLSHDPPYIVTPLVDGGSLDSVGGDRERDLELVERWIEQLAEALVFCHDKGVIHCDLKPSNVFVSSSDDIRLGDFGQSRPAAGAEAAWGTLGFMAPEQSVEGEARVSPSARWDVYGFGATSYWLLTGRVPRLADEGFSGDLDTYQAQLKETPLIPIRELNPAVNPNLAALIEACLKFDPDRRIQNMGAVLEDLQRWREGSPLLCRRPWSIPYLVSLSLRRPMVQAGLLLVLFLIGLGILGWKRKQERTFDFHVTAGRLAHQSGRLNEAYLHWVEALNYNSGDPTTRARIGFMPITQVFPHHERVQSLAFLEDGKTLVTGSGWKRSNGRISVWDVATGALKWDLQRANTPVEKIVANQAKGTFAAGSWDGVAQVFASDSSTPIFEVQHKEDDVGLELVDLIFTSDGEYLLTADVYGMIKVWDAANGEPKDFKSGPDQFGSEQHLAVHPEKGILAGIWSPTSARLWDLKSGLPISSELSHEGAINDLQFSADGKLVVTVADDGMAKVWGVPSGEFIASYAHDNRVRRAAFSSQGFLATGTDDGQVLVRDVAELLNVENVTTHLHHRQPVESLDFSVDGIYLAVGTGEKEDLWSSTEANGSTQVWNANTGLAVAGPWPDDGQVVQVLFHPDGRHLATASGREPGISVSPTLGTANIWALNPPVPGGKPSAKPEESVREVALESGKVVSHGLKIHQHRFSSDRRLLATASSDRTVRLWDAETGELSVPPILVKGEAMAVAFNSTNTWVATASWVEGGSLVQLWESETGFPVCKPLATPTQVHELYFSGDNQRLFAAGLEGAYSWPLNPKLSDRELQSSIPSRLRARLDDSGAVLGENVMSRHDG